MRVLNRGGFTNPDVLRLPPLAGRYQPCIVKDYGARGALHRLIAPLLARHELAQLERVVGLSGVPAWVTVVDSRALAMECIEGAPLTRHEHHHALPAAFFTELQAILEALLARGIVYLDLRSASNVLVTPGGAPALIDFASATQLPLPRALVRWLYARALRKLRERFERRPGESLPPRIGARPQATLDLGRVRFTYRDAGRVTDPVPVLLLHDVGLDHRVFASWFDAAPGSGRRVIAVDLPPFGGSRSAARRARARDRAAELLALLDALRLRRVDVVGHGVGALVGLALAARAPSRVERGLLLEAPLAALDPDFLGRWGDAHLDPAALRARLLAAIPPALDADLRVELERALSAVPSRELTAPYRELAPIAAFPRAYALDRLPPLPDGWAMDERGLLTDPEAARRWLARHPSPPGRSVTSASPPGSA